MWPPCATSNSTPRNSPSSTRWPAPEPRAPPGNRARYVTLELGRWYHLVGVRDAERNEIRLYVDGVLASAAVAGPADVSTGPFAVGRAKWGGGNVDFWKGLVDGVHAFDKALSSEEVAALHAAEKP
ncbi:LamG-like jellyroll fold domain-containing protein [Streptomyces exfoliatus]|uniref:LamG-like jellyroll fold domain-containing protein n=1 Tax=Streptomyces exfoliatus TaxID=1905 RepID=UPI0009987273